MTILENQVAMKNRAAGHAKRMASALLQGLPQKRGRGEIRSTGG
ncbi:hypothetical protein [Permianibacter fluminis]|nr:hypothetical protein [Permianibacter fluminis]